jgi:hypothetical protein
MDTHQTEFVLLGVDPGSGEGKPANRRLVCLIQGGGILAIWGRDGNTSHIDAVVAHGFPCTISCDWRDVPDWASEKYGHTHWLEESAFMKIL